MSIFDLFSNNAQLRGARDIGTGIDIGEQQALPWYMQGIGAAQQGVSTAGQAIPFLQSAYATGAAPLTTAFGGATAGANAYGNALGVNGPQGNAAATQAFQNNPSLAYQLDTINKQQLASDAATGSTGSGNEQIALAKLGQNFANTSWNNYVSNLQPYLNLQGSTAGNLAQLYGNLGNAGSSAFGTQGALSAGPLAQGYMTPGNMYYGGATSKYNALAAADAYQGGNANLLNGILAGGAGLLGFLSDVRVKEDIEPVGKLADDQVIYRYRYAGDPRYQIGLIAQEVEGTTPEAVFDAIGDLKGVDYRRATERAAKILEFTRVPTEPSPMHRPFAYELMGLAA